MAISISGDWELETRDVIPAAIPQPSPNYGGKVVLPLVIKDLEARAEAGKKKYGNYLSCNNDRDALMDAYQEALDLVMYLRQAIEERNECSNKEILKT